MSLGERIRDAREAAGLTQHELAAAVGVTGRTVSSWERDAVAPRSKLGRLEHVLGVRLRGPAPTAAPAATTLDDATDAQLVAALASRLAARDARIRDLTAALDEARGPDNGLPGNTRALPDRWVARRRDTTADTDRAAGDDPPPLPPTADPT